MTNTYNAVEVTSGAKLNLVTLFVPKPGPGQVRVCVESWRFLAFPSDIELGRLFPSEEVLRKLAAALNVPREHLKQYDNHRP
jgi:hypothetical protein